MMNNTGAGAGDDDADNEIHDDNTSDNITNIVGQQSH